MRERYDDIHLELRKAFESLARLLTLSLTISFHPSWAITGWPGGP